MFEKLIDWVKAHKAEDADISEFEELIPKPEEIVKDREVRRAIDSAVSTEVETHDRKFREEKLPKLLDEERKKIRDEVQKELNPEETPEQKEIRELREWKAESQRREKTEATKATLRAKAKDLGFDPERAADFSVYGDDAESMLIKHAEHYKSAVDSRVSDELKKRITGAPKGGEQGADVKTMTRAEFDKLSPESKLKAAKENVITDE